jgi:hypothetical protein
MPNDPLIWIVAIVVGGAVIALALTLGGFVEVGFDPLRLSFRRKQAPARERVSLLDEAEIENAEVGKITGVTRQTGETSETEGKVSDIEVARKAKITGGKIGDITGVSVTGASGTGPKKSDDTPSSG